MRVALVAAAGAAGALARYGLTSLVGRRSFPWATLGINVSGAFLLGLLVAVAEARGWSQDVTAPLAIGFLGAYTTFSTFAYEGLSLGRADRLAEAAAYLVASVVLGVAAAWAGFRAGGALA